MGAGGTREVEQQSSPQGGSPPAAGRFCNADPPASPPATRRGQHDRPRASTTVSATSTPLTCSTAPPGSDNLAVNGTGAGVFTAIGISAAAPSRRCQSIPRAELKPCRRQYAADDNPRPTALSGAHPAAPPCPPPSSCPLTGDDRSQQARGVSR